MENTKNGKAIVTFFVSDLNDPTFYGALDKLDNSPGVLPTEKAWAFSQLKGKLDAMHKLAEQAYKEIVHKYVETEVVKHPDDNGELIPARDTNGNEIRRLKVLRDNDGRVVDYVYSNTEEFKKEMEALMHQSLTEPVELFTVEELTKAGLSPKEMRAIRKIVAEDIIKESTGGSST